MPYYQRLGQVPPKRHTAFRRESDGHLYREEVFGTEGFEGVESILYHIHEPTRVSRLKGQRNVAPDAWQPKQHRHHHLHLGKVDAAGDAVEARRPIALNEECALSIVTPTQPMEGFFRNATADELWFAKQGRGTFETVFGKLPYQQGDYIMIPRGTTYRLPDAGRRFLLVEAPGPIGFPRKYVNQQGQFLEHSPYCERDIHGPSELITMDETGGPYELRVKTWDHMSTLALPHHPFDVVGWDGCNYPFTFNIHDFEPITGRIHQPPPSHLTFEGPGFEVISWVPRKLDYHPQAIPAPYYHANIDTDEVIFYVDGQFTSRAGGVEENSLTIHRRGLHHGPQPGRYEGSIGVQEAHETAVMIEARGHFRLTEHAKDVDDPDYMLSWMGGE